MDAGGDEGVVDRLAVQHRERVVEFAGSATLVEVVVNTSGAVTDGPEG